MAKDGSEKWIDGRLALIEYEGKRAALISAVDITERKQVEEALRERKNARKRIEEEEEDTHLSTGALLAVPS